jgi:spore coat polysaccharide biosynthesis protein SpsF
VAEAVDKVVIATSTETADDVIEQFGSIRDIETYRGSETNVQQRLYEAVSIHDADTIVRITADCPLIDPETIDTVVSKVNEEGAEYASNTIQRTFPRGLDVEAFTFDSFQDVVSAATTQAEREHVTPYYRNNREEFKLANVTSSEVFDEEQYINRTDLRLTLDEAADYYLFKRIYDDLEYSGTIPIDKAIDYIDAEDLSELNESVRQKKI